MSFSVRTTDVEFEAVFAILQFGIRALRHQIEAGQS